LSFGLEVISSGGETIFNSSNKKYYTLVGKMVTRYERYTDGRVLYINPPTIYNPTNSIFVVKPPQGLNTGGRLAWIGVIPPHYGYYSTYKLRFATTDGTGYSYQYPPVEVYVYTTLPVRESSEFGIEVRDDNGELSFNTSKNSLTLQITEQINDHQQLLGMINTQPADGVIISASFYQILAAGETYAKPEIQVFRREGDNIYGAVHTSRESVYTRGGLSFTRTSVALVQLPDWDPPIIDWEPIE